MAVLVMASFLFLQFFCDFFTCDCGVLVGQDVGRRTRDGQCIKRVSCTHVLYELGEMPENITTFASVSSSCFTDCWACCSFLACLCQPLARPAVLPCSSTRHSHVRARHGYGASVLPGAPSPCPQSTLALTHPCSWGGMGLPRTVRAATLAALATAAVVLGAAPPAAGLHFYLLPGQRRCFTDDLPLNTLVRLG